MPLSTIRASAGSGKTYTLAMRFLRLLMETENPATILATTFTRAAAGEIRERVLRLLAEAVISPDALKRLREGTGKNVTADDCARRLEFLVRDLDRLNVMTMDAFFDTIARSFASELEMSPNWTTAVDETAERLSHDAITDFLGNEHQERIVEALASVNKTRMGNSIQETLNSFATIFLSMKAPYEPPAVPIFVTPYKWSATQIAKIDAVLDIRKEWMPRNKTDKPDARWGKALDTLAGILNCETFIREMVENKFLQASLDTQPSYYNIPFPQIFEDLFRETIIPAVRNEVRRLFNDRLVALRWLQWQYLTARDAASFASGLYTFPDIQERVMQRTWTNDALSFRLGTRFEYLLFDEFQDTSKSQFDFFLPLIEEVGSQGEVIIVGDEKQSIYDWRGGCRELMREPLDELAKRIGETAEDPLNKSWRSSRAILDCVNKVFTAPYMAQDDMMSEALENWRKGFIVHEAAKDLPGRARLWKTNEEEALVRVVEIVGGLVDEDGVKEIAILTRTNKPAATIIAKLREKFPALDISEASGSPLCATPAIEWILSLLAYVEHPANTAAREHFFSSSLAKDFLEAAVGEKGHQDIGFLSFLRSAILKRGLASVLHNAMNSEKFRTGVSEEDFSRCRQLIASARAWEASGSGRLDDFITRVRMQRVPRPSAHGAVRVMSFHQAKGLEFDAVILYGLNARRGGINPVTIVEDKNGNPTILPNKDEATILDSTSERDARTQRDLEGELSVLYVGMTRAKRFLDVVLSEGKFLRLFEAAYPQAAEMEKYVMEKMDCLSVLVSDCLIERTTAPSASDGTFPAAPANKTIYHRAAYTTPSSEEGSGSIKTALLLSEEARRARVRGTLVHEWLSRIEWCDTLPSTDVLFIETSKIHENIFSNDHLRKMLENLFVAIANPDSDLHSVLTRPAETPEILREHRFAICLDDGEKKLVQGSFDRVHLWHDTMGCPVRAEIIDFKTDTIANPAARIAIEAQYAPQLARYAQSLRILYPSLSQDGIATRLCFV